MNHNHTRTTHHHSATARANPPAEGELMRSRFSQELVMERDGKILRGHFWTHNGMVTAKLGSRQKTTQIGGSPPKAIAKLMMHEMHEAAKGNPMFV
jgi:hypothetical protein